MKDVGKMTFEEAFAELEEVVRRLEAGGLSLEETWRSMSGGGCWRPIAARSWTRRS